MLQAKRKLYNKFVRFSAAFVFSAAFLLSVTAGILLAPRTQAVYAAIGGSGTAGDPYAVETAADLYAIATSINAGNTTYKYAHIRLYADINLSAYGNWPSIGNSATHNFGGAFDGNGHIIAGLTINDSTRDNAGLFGFITGGTVKNLGLEGVNITARDYTGGLAAHATAVTVTACYVTGTVKGAGYTGGMIGELTHSSSVVQNCYSKVNVTAGSGQVGGLMGWSSNTSISYCYTTGAVTSTGTIAAGISGVKSGGSITNCVAMNGSVTSQNSINNRRIAYESPSFGGGNNYGRVSMPGVNYSVVGAGLNTAQGADVSESVSKTVSFYRNAANWLGSAWDEDVWILQDGEWPLLKNVGVSRQHLGDAVVTLNPDSFVYNGSLQTPAVTVKMSDDTLAVGLDYTWAVTSADGEGTSAGTNAGIVTVTITGKGLYFGTAIETYTIAKAAGAAVEKPELVGVLTGIIMIKPVTAPLNGQSVEYAISTAISFSGIIGGWQDDTYFDGELAEDQYYIFARSKANANYTEGAVSWLLVYMSPPIIWIHIPFGEVGILYSYQMKADKPAVWSHVSGDMPDGLDISEEGLISGEPQTADEFTFTIKAQNAAGYSLLTVTMQVGYATANFVVTITHSPDEMSATILIVYADETLEHQNFSAKGYVFKGLYTDAAMTQRYAASAAVVSDMRLYAKWEREAIPEANVWFIIGLLAVLLTALLFCGKVAALILQRRLRKRKKRKERDEPS